ncbi:Membrane transport protein [Metamycoplasma arthritidis]|uniref:Malate permease n=1 Tax=Metamycoplasma arthritidis (strain 158L3-1) TaxID=243272 RepID=B3PN88_META1|nr:AEC family transporter [Metamycoplasma arthritidis]ACF07490.1 conserved hypothetical protein [Metamycoplasma arthritidis 158L3-1]VEU79011.1 Membrane transport protein [Metamycoplasma arthritidis]
MDTNPGILFQGIITNTGLWAAIIATITITLLGFLLYKFKVLNDQGTLSIQKIIINVLLPFLAFYSFMKNAEKTDIKTLGIVFGLSALYYILLTTIALIWVKLVPQAVPKKIILRAEREFNEWQDSQELEQKEIFNKSAFLDSLKKKHLVTWLMCIYGSNILFATPIIMGVYPQGIQLGALNIWNILYYVGGFGLAYTLISGVRFTKKEFKFTLKKALLNPSLLAILGALILWSSQYIPGAGSTIRDLPLTGEGAKSGTVLIGNQEVVKTFSQVGTFGPNFSKIYAYTYADGKVQWVVWDSIKQLYVPYQGKPTGWFDLNVTMPYLAKPISILASLVSPLIWIVIGTSLAKTDLRAMFASKQNWLFLMFKMILMPALILVMLIPFVKAKILDPSVGAVLVMTGSVPPGTTVVIYSQHFKTHENYTSQVSSLCTMLSFIFIPIWLVIGVVVLQVI